MPATITAATWPEALAKLKRELGPDAVILESGQVAAGVRIVASADAAEIDRECRARGMAPLSRVEQRAMKSVATVARRAYTESAQTGAAMPDTLRTEIERVLATMAPRETAWPKAVSDLKQRMQERGFSAATVDGICGEVVVELSRDDLQSDAPVLRAAQAQLAARIATDLPRSRVQAVLGPTGAGKTTTLCKLALRARREGRRVAILNLDDCKLAAREALRRFGTLAEIPVLEVATPAEVEREVAGARGFDLLLVDTPGCSPADTEGAMRLRGMLSALGEHAKLLVLAAGTHAAVLETLPLLPGGRGAAAVCLTKLDEFARPGCALDTLAAARAPLAWVCTGQRITEDLSPAVADVLARAWLGLPPAARG